jgi:hypothetical protein
MGNNAAQGGRSAAAPMADRRERRSITEGESRGDTASQLHLRLLPHEVAALRHLAKARCQTLSGAVRYLLRKELHADRGAVPKRSDRDGEAGG